MGKDVIDVCRDDGVIRTLDEIEREVISYAIVRCRGNVTAAARALDISRSTLYRKLESYGAIAQLEERQAGSL